MTKSKNIYNMHGHRHPAIPPTSQYVAGFLFNITRDEVILIEKQKPEWQKGKFNAVGGKIELGETPYQAMSREFKEEAGLYIYEGDWKHFCTLHCGGGTIYFFKAFHELDSVKTMEAEQIERICVRDLSCYPHIPNLRWLIPMALESDLKAQVDDPT